MSRFFLNWSNVQWLWSLLAIIPLITLSIIWSQKEKSRFTVNTKAISFRTILQAITLILALFTAILAFMRPAWNPEIQKVEKQGRDVVFLIDVSKSMLAEDIIPNRIRRAKTEIIETVDVFDGDRVALVAFAGSTVMKCPLTMDYSFFKQAVKELDVQSVSRGGSLLGDAVRYVTDTIFDDKNSAFKDIIIITDGDDQDSFAVEAAKQAGEKDIRLIIIGLGDSVQGTRIPIYHEDGTKEFLTYQGKEVWSKLNAKLLRDMASSAKDGRYLNVSTGTFDLQEIYLSLIASEEGQSTGEVSSYKYKEKYQFFTAAALLFLLIELFSRLSFRRFIEWLLRTKGKIWEK